MWYAVQEGQPSLPFAYAMAGLFRPLDTLLGRGVAGVAVADTPGQFLTYHFQRWIAVLQICLSMLGEAYRQIGRAHV